MPEVDPTKTVANEKAKNARRTSKKLMGDLADACVENTRLQESILKLETENKDLRRQLERAEERIDKLVSRN